MARYVIWMVLLVMLAMAALTGCSGELAYRIDPRYDDGYYYDYYSDCPRYWIYNPRCSNCHWY